MKSFKSLLVVSALLLIFCGIFATTAVGQGQASSTLRLEQPLEIGATTLEPGVYMIKVVPSGDRSLLQVTNEDGTKTVATVLAVARTTRATAEERRMQSVYFPTAEGSTRVLKSWFASEAAGGGGYDIVYPEQRAMELATSAKESVVAYKDGTVAGDLKTAKLEVVSATKEVTVYGAPTREEEPMVVAQADELPDTASRLPLFMTLGLLLLLTAGGIRVFRAVQG